MSIKNQVESIDAALSSLPAPLRKRLIKNYSNLRKTTFQKHYDALGHQAGRLAEILIRVLQHLLTGHFDPLTQELGNFKGLCESMERTPKSAGPDGLRIVMPRALLFLYALRNKRDSGHTGGEVDANEIDALTAIRVSDWCLCELIRIMRQIPIEEAQLLCDTIAERRLPAVWSILGRKRVLDSRLNYRDQTLMLLYSDFDTAVATEDLFEWTEHSNLTNFRRDVLSKLHRTRLVEWDRETEMVVLSPLGIREVEEKLVDRIRK